MNRSVILSIIPVLMLAGCFYEFPLTLEHSIAVDSAVLGVWEPSPDDGDQSKIDEQMMILKYSDTEYLVHYPVGKGGLYYRCYPIKIGGVSCIQLEIIGADNGPPNKDSKELFYVVSYQLMDDKLEIKTLDTDLVDDKLKSAEELRDAFLKHKDNKDLFKDPVRFRRIKRESS